MNNWYLKARENTNDVTFVNDSVMMARRVIADWNPHYEFYMYVQVYYITQLYVQLLFDTTNMNEPRRSMLTPVIIAHPADTYQAALVAEAVTDYIKSRRKARL